jgi:hypothetical protein
MITVAQLVFATLHRINRRNSRSVPSGTGNRSSAVSA